MHQAGNFACQLNHIGWQVAYILKKSLNCSLSLGGILSVYTHIYLSIITELVPQIGEDV